MFDLIIKQRTGKSITMWSNNDSINDGWLVVAVVVASFAHIELHDITDV